MSTTNSSKPSTQVAAGSRGRPKKKKASAESTGNPVGRPTLLVEPARSVILTAVSRGCPFNFACEVAGVAYSTFCEWRQRGTRDKRAGIESGFSLLVDDIKKARATFVVDALELINQAGQRQWQAAAWKLERLFPQHFSLQQRELQRALKQLAELEAKLAELQSKTADKPVLKTVG